jgi:hypothetical protein
MSKKPLYIERRPQGDYAIRQSGAERASAVRDTQAQAIRTAKRMTDGPIHVERVRDTNVGGRDKWRRS